MAMWPNETSDLVSIAAADHGELYRSVHNSKEVCNFGSGGPSVDLYARVTPTPALYPAFQLVTGHVTGFFLQHSEGKNRCVAQPRLNHRLLDHVIAIW
jgi:hypothetical protein